MSDSDGQEKVWYFQDDFLAKARLLVRRTFHYLGVECIPLLGFVAVSRWDEEKFKREPVVVRDPRMKWVVEPHELRERARAKAAESSKEMAVTFWLMRESEDEWFLRSALIDDVRSQGVVAKTVSLVSSAVPVGMHEALFVLEMRADDVVKYPHFGDVALEDWSGRGGGMLKAVSRALLSRIENEARKESGGFRRPIEDADIEGVLREAGGRLVGDLRFFVQDELLGGDSLYEWIGAISSLRYESAEAKAVMVFGGKEGAGQFELEFEKKVPLSSAAWARKAVELSSGEFCLYSDGTALHGLVRRKQRSNGEFWVEFRGQSRWWIGVGDVRLMEVAFGVPSLPRLPLREDSFKAAFLRVFGESHCEGAVRAWSVVGDVLGQEHGALVVVVEDAKSEIEHLSSQSMPVTPVCLSGSAAVRAASIDGAILLDSSGICHGVGVILDGEAYPLGDPARGARFNSALRYVFGKRQGSEHRRKCLAVVKSEDGRIDLLPRLRPQISKSKLLDMIERVGAWPAGVAMDPDVQDECDSLVRYYVEYVRVAAEVADAGVEDGESGWGKKAVSVILGNAGARGDGFFLLRDEFDMHVSDLIDEEEAEGMDEAG